MKITRRHLLTSSQQFRRLHDVDDLIVTNQGYAGIGPINWLAFNTAKAPFDDVRVRQAMAFATDRDFITNALHRGTSTQQRGPIIEGSPFFDDSIPTFDVDLDRANALLDEAGLTRGDDDMRGSFTMDFIPGQDEQQKAVAEYLKSQLKKISFGFELCAAPDFPTWSGRVSGLEFDMSMDIVFNWGDPVIRAHRTYLSDNVKKGVIWSNTQSYQNTKVDDLLNAAAQEMDPAARGGLYAEFQQIVGEEVPVYWINALPFHTAYRKNIVNPPLSIWGTMQSMDDVSLS